MGEATAEEPSTISRCSSAEAVSAPRGAHSPALPPTLSQAVPAMPLLAATPRKSVSCREGRIMTREGTSWAA